MSFWNIPLYNHIKSIPQNKKPYMLIDLEMLGQGAAGTTYTANVKPVDKFSEKIVLKEQKRTKYCLNEIEALKFLRDEMIQGRLPNYFIFMYDNFFSGNLSYIILEKAEQSFYDYCVENNVSKITYYNIFWQLADAVSYLENMQFNHGDLWSDNVMLNGIEKEGTLSIKIIDFDSSFKSKSKIRHPSYGGASDFRTHFILGYDLSRFFDSLLFSYNSYIEKKARYKKQKIARMKKLAKNGKKVLIPKIDEQDSSDDEFDAVNIIYPNEIIDFMNELSPTDPDYFEDTPHMSGETVRDLLDSYCY